MHVQVSNLAAHMLKQENGLDVLFKGRAHLVCESAEFLLNFEKEDKKAFADMVALFGKGVFLYVYSYIDTGISKIIEGRETAFNGF